MRQAVGLEDSGVPLVALGQAQAQAAAVRSLRPFSLHLHLVQQRRLRLAQVVREVRVRLSILRLEPMGRTGALPHSDHDCLLTVVRVARANLLRVAPVGQLLEQSALATLQSVVKAPPLVALLRSTAGRAGGRALQPE